MHSVIAAANLVSEVSRFLSLPLPHTHIAHIHTQLNSEGKQEIYIFFKGDKKEKKRRKKRGK